MSESRKRSILRQEYQHLRDQAAAAIMRLGIEPWDAWVAVEAAERTRDGSKATAVRLSDDGNKRRRK